MSGLEVLQAMSGSLYLLTTTVIGFRLLYLAWRNRASAEFMLGASLLLGGLCGAGLEVGASQVIQQGGDSALAANMMLGAKLLGGLGIALYSYFIWRVFRPDERWAAILFFAIAANVAIAIVGFGLAGTYQSGLSSRPWFCFELVGRMAAPAWMVVEALRYYGQMKKRAALDLADPLVANRFLLWGVGGGFGVAMLLTSIPPAFVPMAHPMMPFTIIVLGVAGLGASIPYWLAFFPPTAYKRRFAAA